MARQILSVRVSHSTEGRGSLHVFEPPSGIKEEVVQELLDSGWLMRLLFAVYSYDFAVFGYGSDPRIASAANYFAEISR